MTIYLNSITAFTLYQNESVKEYFVDKTMMLEDIFQSVNEGSNYICITRPRRFGKTVMANMIASFFAKNNDASCIFDSLYIAKNKEYRKHLNQHNVIRISFNELPRNCKSYDQYIERIETILIQDLRESYPDVIMRDDEAVWDILSRIHAEKDSAKFIFVLDEWDYIFHRKFVTDEDKGTYIEFLSSLLKDKPYVSLAYMTGILPIAKYSSGSELNMFAEFTMANTPAFSEYFGFTESEVDILFDRYLKGCEEPAITRECVRVWYDGYHTASGERVYNPRSVVCALRYNHLENYWTSSGPYDEIFYYVEKNIADVRDDLALMIAGIPVPAKVQEYAATSMNLNTKDEIFSAMVVYGFLSYENGMVSIPNRELMDKFSDMLQKEKSLGYVYQLAKASERMLKATLSGDTDTNADCIILELKVNHTPEEAIRQIKDKQYALRFQPKLGESLSIPAEYWLLGLLMIKRRKSIVVRLR